MTNNDTPPRLWLSSFLVRAGVLILLLLLDSPVFSSQVDWQMAGKPGLQVYDTQKVGNNPQNYSIKQGKNGFMYFGNGAGILVFDGAHWSSISYGSQNEILDFDFSSDGRIYVGMMGNIGFFSAGDQGLWSFTSLLETALNSQTAEVPSITRVYRVLVDGDNVYFTSQSHLFYYHPERGLKWVHKPINSLALILDDNGLLISALDGGLYHFNPQTESVKRVYLDSGLKEQLITDFIQLSNGKILAHSRNKLFIQSDITKFSELKTKLNPWLESRQINHIVELPDSSLMLATRQGELAQITLDGELVRIIDNRHGLPKDIITALFVDRESGLWATTLSKGIYRLDINSPISFFSDPDQYTLNSAVIEFKNRLFLGAVDGLFEYKAATEIEGQAEFRRLDVSVAVVVSFIVAGDELLFGHYNGISALSMDDLETYSFRLVHDSKFQQGAYVRQLMRSEHNESVIYGVSDNGIIQLKQVDGVWISNVLVDKINEALNLIQEDSSGDLWAATTLGNFYSISKLDQWPHVEISKLAYPSTNPPQEALVFKLGERLVFNNGTSILPQTLTPDHSGLTEISDIDWSGQDGMTLRLLYQKSKGHAWSVFQNNNTMVGRIGLISADKPGGYQLDYSEFDHLNLQYIQGLFEADSGILWVNSKDKVVRFDPRIKRLKLPLKPPLVSKIEQIGTGQTLYLNSYPNGSGSAANLQAKQGAVRVYFTSAEFSHTETTDYRFKLNGTLHWSAWSQDTSVELVGLNPGANQLEVQYRINPKAVSPALTFSLDREYYWYQRLWAQIIATLLFLALFYVIVHASSRYKTRRLTLVAKQLEKDVATRTQQVRDQYKELEYQHNKLRQMGEAKNRFFTNISHEFRTPLTLSIGPLKEVIDHGNIHSQADRQHLELALKNNLYMMSLLEEVLNINKLESEQISVDMTTLDVPEQILSCIEMFALQVKKQELHFDLVGFETDCQIDFDLDHFIKIIINLISNAIKYSPPKSIIQIGISKQNTDTLIWVKDSGPGINHHDRELIFERFYQGEKPAQNFQAGTGIGLALVKELLTLHASKIEIKSEDGEGACFKICIPAKGSQATAKEKLRSLPGNVSVRDNIETEPSSPAKEADASHTEIKPNNKKIVLIVDDNKDLRLFIRHLLQPLYAIIEAENGLEALDMATEQQPDVIVSDVMMPLMDGYQLAEKLKSSPATNYIPLLLLTARSLKSQMLEGFEKGADDYLNKPFDNNELKARIAAKIKQNERLAHQLLSKFRSKSAQIPIVGTIINRREDKFIADISQLINNNISTTDFGVDALAEGLNTTRSTLFRNVKKHFNCTPKQLIKTKRLELALELLNQQSGSISEVAYAVGFQSLSSFSRSFKENFEVPPTRFSEIELTTTLPPEH